MAHDELAAKLRRDAIFAARQTARAFSWLADEMEKDATHCPRATDLLRMRGLQELFDNCAKLLLLRDLDREGK